MSGNYPMKRSYAELESWAEASNAHISDLERKIKRLEKIAFYAKKWKFLTMDVRISYELPLQDELEKAIEAAAGRVSDYAGTGFGRRDHGWVCKYQSEVKRISAALENIGLAVKLKP